MPSAGVLLAPAHALLGPALTLSLTKLLIPVVSAYIARALAARIGVAPWVAIVGGGLYGFATALSWRADFHLNFAMGALFLPLVVLMTLRFVQDGRSRDAVLAGVALGATALSDQTSATLAAIAAGSMLAGAFATRRDARRRLANGTVVCGACALVVSAPLLLMMWRQGQVDGSVADVATLAQSWTSYNASLASMFSPSPAIRLDPTGELSGLMYRSDIGEASPAYGWAILILALVGAVSFARRRLVVWLIVLWAGATVMALGPELTIGKTVHLPLAVEHHGQRLSGLMPFTWLVELPGFANMRAAARFVLLGILPAAMLATLGIEALRRRGGLALVPLVALLAVAVLEAGWPMDRLDRKVPMTRDALYAPVKADRTNSIVVDVPLSWLGGNAAAGDVGPMEGMLRATEHGHPVATGFVSRLGPNRLQALSQHRFYTDLIVQQKGGAGNPGFPAPDPAAGAKDAAALNVGWVVVWEDADPRVLDYLAETGFREVRQDRGVKLFRRDER